MDNARTLVLEAQAKLTVLKDLLDLHGLGAIALVDRWELVNQLEFVAEYATQLAAIIDGRPSDRAFWDGLAH